MVGHTSIGAEGPDSVVPPISLGGLGFVVVDGGFDGRGEVVGEGIEEGAGGFVPRGVGIIIYADTDGFDFIFRRFGGVAVFWRAIGLGGAAPIGDGVFNFGDEIEAHEVEVGGEIHLGFLRLEWRGRSKDQ